MICRTTQVCVIVVFGRCTGLYCLSVVCLIARCRLLSLYRTVKSLSRFTCTETLPLAQQMKTFLVANSKWWHINSPSSIVGRGTNVCCDALVVCLTETLADIHLKPLNVGGSGNYYRYLFSFSVSFSPLTRHTYSYQHVFLMFKNQLNIRCS